MAPEYRYWAWLSEGDSSVDDAREIIRTWLSPEGHTRAESYVPGSGWETTWTYRDVRDQHERGHLLPITEDDVERFRQQRG